MNKRLVWNFEIDTADVLEFEDLSTDDTDELRWEARYFWPEDEIITLAGLSEDVLAFSDLQIKHRQDRYYLLADHPFNIKRRHFSLIYKPLIATYASCEGFGKKINLSSVAAENSLPGMPFTAAQLKEMIKANSEQVSVTKTALIAKLTYMPVIKLELTRLQIDKLTYFSACVEGHSAKMVTLISKQLFKNQQPTDYMTFLRAHPPG